MIALLKSVGFGLRSWPNTAPKTYTKYYGPLTLLKEYDTKSSYSTTKLAKCEEKIGDSNTGSYKHI